MHTAPPNPARPPATPLADPPVAEVLHRIRSSATLSPSGNAHDLLFQAMGTRCRVTFAGPVPPGRVQEQLLAWVATFEARYSRFIPSSWVSQVNTAAGGPPLALPAEFAQLLNLCGQITFLTRGTLDPSSLPLLRLWDWKTGRIPSETEIESARSLCGWKRIELHQDRIRLPLPGMAIDLGGVGKEYAVDQSIALLASLGVQAALVDYGADIRVLGDPPDGRPAWKIGLEDPLRPGQPWTHLIVRNSAVATSGDYIRGFTHQGRRFGHILDPRTGRPVDNGVLSASVLAPSCTQAGMLSTALCILGPDEGRRLLAASPGVEGCILTRNGPVTSPRFHEYVPTLV